MNAGLVQKATTYRWFIFVVLSAAYVLVFFHRLCPAVLAVDMMRDLQSSGALIGLLGSAYFYPYALMQPAAGLLADSWGPRRTITVFFLIACAGSIILGLAPDVTWAIAGRVLVGLGVAMVFVPSMKIFAEWFAPSEFARLGGFLLAMGGLGSFTAAAPLAYLSSRLGWRESFVSVGGLTLVLAMLVWLVVRDKPSDMGLPSPTGERKTGPAGQSLSLIQGMKTVLVNRSFWPLAGFFFFSNAIFFSFGGLWGGPFLAHVHGLSKAQAGNILSMVAVGLIVGSPLLSYLSDKVFRARKPVLLLAAAAVIGVMALLAFKTGSLSTPLLYLVCFGVGFTGSMMVLGFTMTKELYPVSIAGTALGLVNIFPFTGGALFQIFLGYILERYGKTGDAFTLAGYEQAFMSLFGCAVLALVFGLFTKETLSRGSSSSAHHPQRLSDMQGLKASPGRPGPG